MTQPRMCCRAPMQIDVGWADRRYEPPSVRGDISGHVDLEHGERLCLFDID